MPVIAVTLPDEVVARIDAEVRRARANGGNRVPKPDWPFIEAEVVERKLSAEDRVKLASYKAQYQLWKDWQENKAVRKKGLTSRSAFVIRILEEAEAKGKL